MKWEEIYINEGKNLLDGYPKRDEDVTFIHSSSVHTGYFINDTNYEDPSDSVFGFIASDYHENECHYVECEFVQYWCYTKDLIESVV